MDYILSGYIFFNSALKLQNHLIEILSSRGMLLHKWCSNSPQLCQTNDKGIQKNLKNYVLCGNPV